MSRARVYSRGSQLIYAEEPIRASQRKKFSRKLKTALAKVPSVNTGLTTAACRGLGFELGLANPRHESVSNTTEIGSGILASEAPISITPLELAVQENRPLCVKLFLEGGADYHTRGSQSVSIFHMACQMGRVECVEELLQHRADPNSAVKDFEPHVN